MRKLLSVREVEAIREPGRHPVGEGLYLAVDESGRRRWFFRYQIGGRRREMGLGPYPTVGLKQAREEAAGAKRLAQAGTDPLADEQAESRHDVTFGTVADDLVASLERGYRNEKHRYQWRQTLGDAYCRSLRQKPVSAVTTDDVLSVLSPIWSVKPETASRLRQRIEKVLDAAKARGLRTGDNPAAWKGHLANLLPPQRRLTRGHQPAMAFAQVPAFMVRLGARESVSAAALQFLILTAARAGEVYGATWVEVDLATKLWTVPAGRMKGGKPHRVPLSDAAVAVLGRVELLRQAKDAYLFPGARAGRPLSNMAFKQLLTRMGETGFVPHGFRSSFRDWCGECTDFPREVAEAALAHAVGDDVERAYRRGDALEKRRRLMDEWAMFCMPK